MDFRLFHTQVSLLLTSLFCDQEKQLPGTQSSHTQCRNIGVVLGLQARHCRKNKEQSAEDTPAA